MTLGYRAENLRVSLNYWYNRIPAFRRARRAAHHFERYVWASVDITISLRSGRAAHHPLGSWRRVGKWCLEGQVVS